MAGAELEGEWFEGKDMLDYTVKWQRTESASCPLRFVSSVADRR